MPVTNSLPYRLLNSHAACILLLIVAGIAISGVSAAGTMTLYEDDFGPALKIR